MFKTLANSHLDYPFFLGNIRLRPSARRNEIHDFMCTPVQTALTYSH
ncbi:hypothetical protein NEIFL0001_1652 [Neisseria flavescens SK114]|nr:hypothetical protein NEIFL0001_1652 [Neisseria flavescens SK114]